MTLSDSPRGLSTGSVKPVTLIGYCCVQRKQIANCWKAVGGYLQTPGGGWESKISRFLDLPLYLVLPSAIANSVEANTKLTRESGFVDV
jgi:hypothetical protein